MISIVIQGFLLQASLILALGAQNIFVLNSGLRKKRHFLVALVSSICDTTLIFVGVLGVDTFFIQCPILKISLGIAGVSFLFFYGAMKINESRNTIDITTTSSDTTNFWQTIFASLAFSLLNPHVYLDTIVLVGGYSSKFSVLSERFFFGLGASSFSTLWFFGLAFSASLFGSFLNNQKAMRMVSLVSGIILVLLALKLGAEVTHWIIKD